MSQAPLYVDISQWQPANIDWPAYRKWAAQWDGIARVAMRSSFGNGYTDQHFEAYRAGALSAGIDVIIFYHYAYAQFNAAQTEADWQHKAVGAIRETDMLMLDYEENTQYATAEWAYEWLSRQESNYSGKLPTLYASDAYVRERLQDVRLARFPLIVANWQFSPSERPPCPPPWKEYLAVQYTDRASGVPGIAGHVDANIYIGKEEEVMKITIDTPGVSEFFSQNTDGPWTCKANGKIILGPILDFYRSFGNAALCGLTFLGLPQSNAIILGASAKQHFERGVVALDAKHVLDHPPGAGEVYLLQLYNGGEGEDPRVKQLQSQVMALQNTQADPQLLQKIDQLKILVANL